MCNIMTSGIMYCDILDHLPIFSLTPTKQSQSVKNINDTKVIEDFNTDFLERFNHFNKSDKT